MKLFEVEYKGQFSSQPNGVCHIAAPTLGSALREATMFIKKKFYGGSREILRIEFKQDVDRVAK